MSMPGALRLCPQCGAANPRSSLVTMCSSCSGLLEASTPDLNKGVPLPPPPPPVPLVGSGNLPPRLPPLTPPPGASTPRVPSGRLWGAAAIVGALLVVAVVLSSMGRWFGQPVLQAQVRPAQQGVLDAAEQPAPLGPILFTSTRDGNADIYVMASDGADQVRLTQSPAADDMACWSPDGFRFAYQSDQDGAFGIRIMEAEGTHDEVLMPTGQDDRYPSWSPDGASMAYASRRSGTYDIYLVDVGGGSERPLTDDPADDCTPDWSPDGSELAFQTNRSGEWEIWTMEADGRRQRKRVSLPGPSYAPEWSPDGRRLAFSSGARGNQDIYVVDLADDSLTRLTDTPAEDYSPCWSPDGQHIAFDTWRDGQAEIYVMCADGSDQTNLTKNPANDWHPVWWAPPPAQPADAPGAASGAQAQTSPEVRYMFGERQEFDVMSRLEIASGNCQIRDLEAWLPALSARGFRR